MPTAASYVEVQYSVAKLIDSDAEITTEEFERAASEERAITMLDEKYGDIIDLSLIMRDPDNLREMEKELSAAVEGNSSDEYGIMENGLAGYVVHLTELMNAT